MSDDDRGRRSSVVALGTGVASGLALTLVVVVVAGELALSLGPLSFRAALSNQHSIWLSNSSGQDLIVRVYAADTTRAYLVPDTSQVENTAASSIPDGPWMGYQVLQKDKCVSIVAAGDIQPSVRVVFLAIGPQSVWSTVDPRHGPANIKEASETGMCPLGG